MTLATKAMPPPMRMTPIRLCGWRPPLCAVLVRPGTLAWTGRTLIGSLALFWAPSLGLMAMGGVSPVPLSSVLLPALVLLPVEPFWAGGRMTGVVLSPLEVMPPLLMPPTLVSPLSPVVPLAPVVPLSPLVLREITYRVLAGPQGGGLRQIASAGAPAHRIARAIRWLKDHFAEPLGVEALARQVGMRPSAFHLHFKAVTGLSPLQYQKQLRLQEARRLMLGEGLDAAEAAYRVGYESPSQFSREYRRAFGTPPKQDVAALKVAPQPASYSGV